MRAKRGKGIQRVKTSSGPTPDQAWSHFCFLDRCGMKMSWAYLLKVFTALGFSIWAVAAPSIIVQVTLGSSENALQTTSTWEMITSHPGGDQAHQTVLEDKPDSHVEKTQCTTLKRAAYLVSERPIAAWFLILSSQLHYQIQSCCSVQLDYPLALFDKAFCTESFKLLLSSASPSWLLQLLKDQWFILSGVQLGPYSQLRPNHFGLNWTTLLVKLNNIVAESNYSMVYSVNVKKLMLYSVVRFWVVFQLQC